MTLTVDFPAKEAPEALYSLCHNLTEENKTLTQKVDILREENDRLLGFVRLLKKQIYGSKSEKTPPVSVNQQSLGFFDEAPDPVLDLEACEDPLPKETKKRGRRPLSQEFPREQVIHDLSERGKVCRCGHLLHKIGEETSEQLDYIPATFRIIQNVRYKYACGSCQEVLRTAPAPKVPLPKSIASPGLLAHVLVSKFQDHLPLYRQTQMWKRLGIDLSRSTMGNWVMECGAVLEPIVALLKKEIVSDNYVHADETTVQVLHEPNRKATTKSYMWVYTTGSKHNKSLVYEYQPTRAGEHATTFLKDFQGYLQTDAYSGYKGVGGKEGVIPVGCMAHGRRKFVDVLAMTASKTGKAFEAVSLIAKLYEIESTIKGLPPDTIKEQRHLRSRPLLEGFKKWLELQRRLSPPKNPLGSAVQYVLNHWVELTRYLDDGRLEIDNNPAEQAIRPFAVGRRNWLFMGNTQGAEAAATIYSLIETCKANNINAYAYLRHALTRIPTTSEKDMASLLPWNCPLDLLKPEANN